MTEDRLMNLEVKISHQEITIETLQQLVYEQHKTIEALEVKVVRLGQRLEGFVEGGSDITAAHERPPHY